MERSTQRPLKILTGLLMAAICGFGQAYTISAKPGAVNYVEGSAFLNGTSVSDRNLKGTFLAANDTFSTKNGKAEILLTPGVFLRLGENTEVRMVTPTLTDTRFEAISGEVMVEASGLVKENNIQVVDRGAVITIAKNGLYRFTANDPPTAAVLDGKANLEYSGRKVDLKKGRETIIAANLAVQKFDTKQEDDLYAWSNVRSEYEAAASYHVARDANLSAFNLGFGPAAYGYGGLGTAYGSGFGAGGFGPGWYWDNGFNSYAWLPGNGIFYSPFGYGFYSPGYVGYAPVVTTSVYRGGHPWRGRNGNTPVSGTGITAEVPVSTKNPPVVGGVTTSPWAAHQARVQAARAFAASNGGNAAGSSSGNWRGGNAAGWRAQNGGTAGNSAGAAPHVSSGTAVGGNHAGGFGGGGGGHSGGFSGGGGGGHTSGGPGGRGK